MKINRYNHLLTRVEYPAESGYRMEPSPLPDWIYITISEDKDNKWLTVHSRLHVNKEIRIHPTYSSDFPDSYLIKDLSGEVASRFL